MAADNTRPTIDSEVAAWIRNARTGSKFGILAVFSGWLLSQKPTRQAIGRAMNIANLTRQRAQMEVMPMVRDALGWSEHEYEQGVSSAVWGLILLAVTGLTCVLTGAFIDAGFLDVRHVWHADYGMSLLWKAVVCTTGGIITFSLIHEWWMRRIVPLMIVGVANKFLSGVDESTLTSFGSIMKFAFSRPSAGVSGGLGLVHWLWRICGMICFWWIVGSQYIIWVPLAGVKPLLFASLPCIPIFFLGTCVWTPKVRGREISWILWAELFMLIDVAVLAMFKAELYVPLMTGNVWARLMLLAALVAETFVILHIVSLGRSQPSESTASGGSTGTNAAPSNLRQPRPVGAFAWAAIIFLVVILGGVMVHEAATHNPSLFTIETALPLNQVQAIALIVLGIGIVCFTIYALATIGRRR